MDTKIHSIDVFILLSQSNFESRLNELIEWESIKTMGHIDKTPNIHTSQCQSLVGYCIFTVLMIICRD